MTWTTVDIFMQADARPQKQAARNNGMSPVIAKNFFILMIKTEWSEEEKEKHSIHTIYRRFFHTYVRSSTLLFTLCDKTHKEQQEKKRNPQLLNWLFRENKYFISRIENESKTKETKTKYKTNEWGKKRSKGNEQTDRDEEEHVEKMPKVFETICI